MSVEATVWLISVAGALAFIAGGFLFGRLTSRKPAMAAARPEPAAAPRRPATEPPPLPPTSRPVTGQKRRPTDPWQPKTGPSRRPTDPYLPKTGPTPRPAINQSEPTALVKAVDNAQAVARAEEPTVLTPAQSGFREENLASLLGTLDEDGELHAVLADDRGLPMAVWGPETEASAIAAMGANAALMCGRVSELDLAKGPDKVEVRLGDGRIFQSRPVSIPGNTFQVVSIGTTVPSDERFGAIQRLLERLLAEEVV